MECSSKYSSSSLKSTSDSCVLKWLCLLCNISRVTIPYANTSAADEKPFGFGKTNMANSMHEIKYWHTWDYFVSPHQIDLHCHHRYERQVNKPNKHSRAKVKIKFQLAWIMFKYHCMAKFVEKPKHQNNTKAQTDPARQSMVFVHFFNKV